MAEIQTLLKNILGAVYGKDVRQSIHDAISKCYEDGKAGQLDLVARNGINEIKTNYQPKLMLNDALVNVDAKSCIHVTESAEDVACYVVTLTTYNHAVWDVVALVNIFDENANVDYLYKGANVRVDFVIVDGRRIIRIWNDDATYGTNTARMTAMKI